MATATTYPEQLLAAITATSVAAKGALLADVQAPADGDEWPTPDLPERPGRPAGITERAQPARRRRGLQHANERLRFLHAIWHIECSAIDLACLLALRGSGAPSGFHRDCLRVAREEVEHATLIADLLSERGYPPGSEPVHFRLWDAARGCTTLSQQVVVIPRILEARGLDVTAALLPRIKPLDAEAHAILERIYRDEIGHVAVGSRWHHWWCEHHAADPAEHLAEVILAHFPEGALGPAKPDQTGRQAAGFTPAELAVIGKL